MTEVTEDFVYGYLYNKLIEAAKAVQEVVIALDPCEEELIARLSGIIDEILETKF